eukprot:4186344-Amphidinium_carterae.1
MLSMDFSAPVSSPECRVAFPEGVTKGLPMHQNTPIDWKTMFNGIECQFSHLSSSGEDMWSKQEFVEDIWNRFTSGYHKQLLSCHHVGVNKEGEPTGGTPLGQMRLHWKPSLQQTAKRSFEQDRSNDDVFVYRWLHRFVSLLELDASPRVLRALERDLPR